MGRRTLLVKKGEPLTTDWQPFPPVNPYSAGVPLAEGQSDDASKPCPICGLVDIQRVREDPEPAVESTHAEEESGEFEHEEDDVAATGPHAIRYCVTIRYYDAAITTRDQQRIVEDAYRARQAVALLLSRGNDEVEGEVVAEIETR